MHGERRAPGVVGDILVLEGEATAGSGKYIYYNPDSSHMARKRRPRNYKVIETASKSLGDAGEQILLGTIQPITSGNQAFSGWFKNVVCTYVLQDEDATESSVGGIVFYLSSNTTWADDDVITARAVPFGGGTVSLTANRKVSGELFDDMVGGKVALWAEATDVSAVNNLNIRYTVECWGRFIQYFAS